jgi:chemotaxis response regulator CheB
MANRPRLMRDLILATVSDQPDIEVVGESEDDFEIFEAIEQTRPDFLIVALDESNERPVICDSVLEKFPNMKIIALAPHRNSSIYYWGAVQIHSSRIEASEDGVLNTLRGRPQLVRGEP